LRSDITRFIRRNCRKLDVLRIAKSDKRNERKKALLEFYNTDPASGPTEASKATNVIRRTVYTYQKGLFGKIRLGPNGRGAGEMASQAGFV
jgi:hypothetical protein